MCFCRMMMGLIVLWYRILWPNFLIFAMSEHIDIVLYPYADAVFCVRGLQCIAHNPMTLA